MTSNTNINTNYRPYGKDFTTNFNVSNLKPNKTYYVYLDDILMNNEQFSSDSNGDYSGPITFTNIISGVHTFKVADSNIITNIDWFAEDKITIQDNFSTDNIQCLRSINLSPETQGIFQSFLINANSGIFLTKVGLFFKNRPNANVNFAIRLVNEDEVSNFIIPGTTKVINYEDVTANEEYIVEFDYPVYFDADSEYTIHILTSDSFCEMNAQDYGVGNFIKIGGGFRVTFKKDKPNNVGSIYYYNKKWEKIKTKSISFNLYQAQFDTVNTGIIDFNIINDGTKQLKYNPLESTASSNILTIYDVENFEVNEIINITGTGDPVIDTGHYITEIGVGYVKTDNYITGGSQTALPNFTETRFFGGSNVEVNENITYNRCVLNMNDLELDNTDVDYQLTSIPSSRSLGNALVSPIYNKKINDFENKQILIDETNKGVENYLKLAYNIETNDPNISPMIDLTNVNVFLMDDKISNSTYLSKPISASVQTNKVQLVWETVKTPNADYDVYLILDGTEILIDEYNIYSKTNEYVSYNYVYEGITFSACQLKIIFKGSSSAKIQNLRIKLLNT